MSNDTLHSSQIPLALPSLQDQALQFEDKPLGKLSFGQKLDSTFQVGPEHSEVFSLSRLRSNFPVVEDRVSAAWSVLCSMILEHVPYDDHRQTGLVLVEELVSLTGVEIGDSARKYFEKYHLDRIPFNGHNDVFKPRRR